MTQMFCFIASSIRTWAAIDFPPPVAPATIACVVKRWGSRYAKFFFSAIFPSQRKLLSFFGSVFMSSVILYFLLFAMCRRIRNIVRAAVKIRVIIRMRTHIERKPKSLIDRNEIDAKKMASDVIVLLSWIVRTWSVYCPRLEFSGNGNFFMNCVEVCVFTISSPSVIV